MSSPVGTSLGGLEALQALVAGPPGRPRRVRLRRPAYLGPLAPARWGDILDGPRGRSPPASRGDGEPIEGRPDLRGPRPDRHLPRHAGARSASPAACARTGRARPWTRSSARPPWRTAPASWGAGAHGGPWTTGAAGPRAAVARCGRAGPRPGPPPTRPYSDMPRHALQAVPEAPPRARVAEMGALLGTARPRTGAAAANRPSPATSPPRTASPGVASRLIPTPAVDEIDTLDELGKPRPAFVPPTAAAPLWRLHDPRAPHANRCHVGHAYTAPVAHGRAGRGGRSRRSSSRSRTLEERGPDAPAHGRRRPRAGAGPGGGAAYEARAGRVRKRMPTTSGASSRRRGPYETSRAAESGAIAHAAARGWGSG